MKIVKLAAVLMLLVSIAFAGTSDQKSGEEIKSHEPRLFLGAAANPFAEPFEYRAPRLGKKVANGADFI